MKHSMKHSAVVLVSLLAVAMCLAPIAEAQPPASNVQYVNLSFSIAQSLTLSIGSMQGGTIILSNSVNTFANTGVIPVVTYLLSGSQTGISVVPYFSSSNALVGTNPANVIPVSSFEVYMGSGWQPCGQTDASGLGLGANTCPPMLLSTSASPNTGSVTGGFGFALSALPTAADNYSGVLSFQATTY